MTKTTFPQIRLNPAFYNNSLPMALCTKEFVFLDLNDGAANVLGYQKEELLGKSIMDITAIGDLSFDFKNLEKLLKGEIESYTIKRAYKNKEGKKVHGAITSSLVTIKEEKYILGIFYQRVDAMSEMQLFSDEYGLMSKILRLNPDVHYIMDIEKRAYVYQNVDILNFFGYDQSDVEGRNVIEFLISKIDASTIHEVAQASQEFRTSKGIGEFVQVEYRFLTKNDGWKWLKAKSTPLVQGENEEIKLSYGIIQDITERKLIEEKLQSQESFISQVANLVPDIINVYDIKRFKNVYSNLGTRTFLGYTLEEWETKGAVRTDPRFSSHIKNSLESLIALKDDEVFTDEALYLDKNDEPHWLLIKAKVFKRDANGEPEQMLAVIADINDYKQALENLDVSRKTTTAILDAIPDLLLVVDREGVYQNVFAGVDLKGNAEDHVIGDSIFNVLEKHNADVILALIRSCIKTGKTKMYNFKHRYDSDRPDAYFSNYISKLTSNEVIILVREETKTRKMQIALDEKVQQLSDKNEEMQEFIAKNTELERFAYIISHDLKEPLRSISAITELIKFQLKDTPNKVLMELLNHLTLNNSRMEELIQGVLQYSRVEGDSKRHALDLEDIVKSVLNDLKAMIEERHVLIEVKNLFAIKGDETQIRQLFQNLIINSIKFNDSKEVKIIIGSEDVDGTPTCYIKDNGIGIADEFKDSIFKMFKRVNTYNQFPGQGLGLSICKKIIDKHHGKIWVENNEPKGSSFYFTLQ